MVATNFSKKIEIQEPFEDFDMYDELDPAMKEELDREVEDFARRLNSDWPERMKEIFSLSQDRSSIPSSLNGNGSFGRCAGNGM